MADLFIINRYDPNEHEEDAKTDENTKLDKILQKIEQKKQKRISIQENTESSPPKKKKKRKSERCDDESTTKLENETQQTLTAVSDIQVNGISVPNAQESLIVESEPSEETNKQLNENNSGFEILSAKHTKRPQKVKRVLPKWLRTPTVIKTDLKDNLVKIKGLDSSLKKKLKENGILKFFPVQSEVIPWVLESRKFSDVFFPRDACISAPTGSGKTLAYVLPIIQSLQQHFVKKIRALVILPTQDLAMQVFHCFRIYCKGTNLTPVLITGKTSFELEQKQLVYENVGFGYLSKADILVCTAGRLVDHIKGTKGFCLNDLEFLVIDEADRVLESVQHDWMYHLQKHLMLYQNVENQEMKILNLQALSKPRPPQKLLFSATLTQDPEKLERMSLFQPILFTSIIDEELHFEETELKQNEAQEELKAQHKDQETFIGKYTTPKELTEKYLVCSLDLKPLVLFEYIKRNKLRKTIVFTHSLETVHNLSILLKALFENEMKIAEVSSQLSIKKRNELIEEYSKGNIDVLVCTDALARGIDLPGVQCVISYSAPKHIKTYIHRAGRTARAGQEGLALTMLQESQLNKFQEIMKQAGKTNIQEDQIDESELEDKATKYQEALGELKKTVLKEKKKAGAKDTVHKKRKNK